MYLEIACLPSQSRSCVEEYLQHNRSFFSSPYSGHHLKRQFIFVAPFLHLFLSHSFFFSIWKKIKNQLQFCTHDETSNKELFPTFARTRPPDTQISKSVASVLKAFHWHKVAFFHKSTDDSEYAKVSQSTTQQHVTQIRSISQSNMRSTSTYWNETGGLDHAYCRTVLYLKERERKKGRFI